METAVDTPIHSQQIEQDTIEQAKISGEKRESKPLKSFKKFSNIEKSPKIEKSKKI